MLPDSMNAWISRWKWKLAAGAFACFLLVFCADALPWIRGFRPWPPEWRWLHQPGKAPIFASAIILTGLASAWLLAKLLGQEVWGGGAFSRGRQIRFLAVLIGLHLAVQASGLAIRDPRIVFLAAQRTCVDWLNSFFKASLAVEKPGDAWTRFDDLLNEPEYPRVVTHPPGFVAFYAFVRNSAGALRLGASGEGAKFWRSAIEPLPEARTLPDGALSGMLWAALLQPLWAALALIPLYDLIRRHHGGAAAAKTAFLYALSPAAALFVPAPDELFLPLGILAVWAFSRACSARLTPQTPGGPEASRDSCAGMALFPNSHAGYLILSGAAIALHGLMGYHFTLIIFLLGLWRLGLAARGALLGQSRGEALWGAVRDGAMLALPILVLWAILQAMFHYSYLIHWAQGIQTHRQGITHYRSYWGWAIWNLWDMAMFLGLPFGAAIFCGLRKRMGFASPYFLSLALTLLAMTLSGSVRGETARILLFMFPMILPLAAPAMAETFSSPRRFRALALAQAFQTACMAIFLNLF